MKLKKSVTLVIAIAMMMIFAILGSTLLMMQSADFEMNAGNLNSERALYVAESGAEYVVKQVIDNSSWRQTVQHQLDFGEYEALARDPVSGEEGDVIIESIGYIPAESNYQTKRHVKLTVVIGSLEKVLQAKNLFDWSGCDSHTKINDDIVVGIEGLGYEGDGDGIYNELGVDYGEGVPDQRGERGFFSQGAFPEIDMDYFRTNAKQTFPDPLSRVITATISSINGSNIEVSDANFFDDMADEAVRNLTLGGWTDDTWRAISSVPGGYNGRRATLESSVAGVWNVGDEIRLVKRFYESLGLIETLLSWNRYWYMDSDVIVDARDDDVDILYTSNVATGDIILIGNNKINMRSHLLLPSYPLFATKDGNITSFAPQTGNDQNKMKNRAFYGLIYSQNGTVYFNYLYGIVGSWRGVAIMGNNVIFEGRVQIDYSTYFIDNYGFDFKASALYWQEE